MKKSENGRSMIEMLGVLAIIGVLSVGGIYGYTVAMRKYKANEVAQTLSMLATMAHAKNAGEGASLTLASSGLELSPAGVTLTGTTTKCAKTDGTEVDDNNVGTQGCALIKVTMSIADDTGDQIRNAVCSIVPKTAAAGANAGYWLTGCPS